ncbi:hypothetical protein PG988_012712 [Apiospora saccharicola]
MTDPQPSVRRKAFRDGDTGSFAIIATEKYSIQLAGRVMPIVLFNEIRCLVATKQQETGQTDHLPRLLPSTAHNNDPASDFVRYRHDESDGDDAQQHNGRDTHRVAAAGPGRPPRLLLLAPVPRIPVPHGRRRLAVAPLRVAGRAAPGEHRDAHPGRGDVVDARPQGRRRGRRREDERVAGFGTHGHGPRAEQVRRRHAKRDRVDRRDAQDLGRGQRRDGGDAAVGAEQAYVVGPERRSVGARGAAARE